MTTNQERSALAAWFRYSGQPNGHALRCGAALAIHHGETRPEEIDAAARAYAEA